MMGVLEQQFRLCFREKKALQVYLIKIVEDWIRHLALKSFAALVTRLQTNMMH